MTRIEGLTDTATHPTRLIGDDASAVDGPTLIVIGGLHGNEPAGIDAACHVHGALSERSLSLTAGRFISLRGNLAALSSSTLPRPRFIDEDLNRAFTGRVDDGPPVTIEQQQREEIRLVLDTIVAEASHPVYLLDLHTVSSESPPFVVLEDSLAARRFASAFPLPKMLGLEEELQGLLIDEATQRLGCVACIIESGRHDDPQAVIIHEALILLALERLGMISPGSRTLTGVEPRRIARLAAGDRAGHFYDLRQRVIVSHESFEMLPTAEAFCRVRARQTILAMERSLPLTADASGLLFMPNRQPLRRIGEDGFFIIQRIGRPWLVASALLRRVPALHVMLPMLLPGVRRRPGDPHAIIVAPEYAAILRREVLHLLGYRLVRWDHTPYLKMHQRIVRGVTALCASVLGILVRATAGGEKAALPAEREVDWIARRRKLDVEPPSRSIEAH